MEEKKYNISSGAIAILSFALIFFGFIEGALLLLGFSIIIQKDQWLTKQVLQALYLRIVYLVGILVVGWLFKGLLFILNLVDAYKAMESAIKVQGFIEGAIYVAMFVLVVMGIMKILKGQDADIPIVNSFAGKTLGERNITTNRNQPPMMYQEYGSAPQTEGPRVVTQEDLSRVAPGDEGIWRCSCGTENFGKFCVSCGQKKEERGVSD